MFHQLAWFPAPQLWKSFRQLDIVLKIIEVRNLCLCVNGCNSNPRQVPDYAVEFEKKPFSPRSFDSRQAVTNVFTFFQISSWVLFLNPSYIQQRCIGKHYGMTQKFITFRLRDICVDYFLKPHACSETNFTGTFCCYVWHLRLIHLLYQIIDNETEFYFQNEHMFFSFFL